MAGQFRHNLTGQQAGDVIKAIGDTAREMLGPLAGILLPNLSPVLMRALVDPAAEGTATEELTEYANALDAERHAMAHPTAHITV